MKYLLGIAFAICLSVSLVGCGPNSSVEVPDVDKAGPPPTDTDSDKKEEKEVQMPPPG